MAVSRVLSWATIPLDQQSLTDSSNLPDPHAGHTLRDPIWSCSGWSLPCHTLLPEVRCALTAPFHPYRHVNMLRRPFGARTFLPFLTKAAIAWPTPRRILHEVPYNSTLFLLAVKAVLNGAFIEQFGDNKNLVAHFYFGTSFRYKGFFTAGNHCHYRIIGKS